MTDQEEVAERKDLMRSAWTFANNMIYVHAPAC